MNTGKIPANATVAPVPTPAVPKETLAVAEDKRPMLPKKRKRNVKFDAKKTDKDSK